MIVGPFVFTLIDLCSLHGALYWKYLEGSVEQNILINRQLCAVTVYVCPLTLKYKKVQNRPFNPRRFTVCLKKYYINYVINE